MLKLRRNSRAQSLSEYVLLIAIIGVALIGMQTYMKRGVQGVVQVAADAIGDQRKGSIEQGRAGEIRTIDPNESWQRKVTTETNATSSTILHREGKVEYGKNETTELPKTHGGNQKEQRLHHEWIYNEE
jgi:Flp pilus assembly pilin Flp